MLLATVTTVCLHIYINIKGSICWRTAQPLALIMYSKSRGIKNPWSSSRRLPQALISSHDLCINTGWQKEDLTLPKFLPVSLELRLICLKWLHEAAHRCQCSRLLLPLLQQAWEMKTARWGKLEANHFVIMVKDVGMPLMALIGSIMITLYWSFRGK